MHAGAGWPAGRPAPADSTSPAPDHRAGPG